MCRNKNLFYIIDIESIDNIDRHARNIAQRSHTIRDFIQCLIIHITYVMVYHGNYSTNKPFYYDERYSIYRTIDAFQTKQLFSFLCLKQLFSMADNGERVNVL